MPFKRESKYSWIKQEFVPYWRWEHATPDERRELNCSLDLVFAPRLEASVK